MELRIDRSALMNVRVFRLLRTNVTNPFVAALNGRLGEQIPSRWELRKQKATLRKITETKLHTLHIAKGAEIPYSKRASPR
jgi:hypothetical protein